MVSTMLEHLFMLENCDFLWDLFLSSSFFLIMYNLLIKIS